MATPAIPIRAVPNTVGPGEEPNYRLVAKDTKHIAEEELLRRLAEQAGFDIPKGRYWMDVLQDVLFAALAANETVDAGFLYAKLYPTGTIPSLTAQPTKEANPVKGRVFFKGEFANRLAALGLVNETQTVNPIVYEIQQDGVDGLNRIESTTARVVINVSRAKVVDSQEDNGVIVEDLKTNAKVAEATVVYSDSSTCHVTFPTLPATGRYRLVILTRDGEDPEEYVLARATRIVEIVNGEVTHV